LTYGRYELTAASARDLVLFAGGTQGNFPLQTFVSVVEIYNVRTQQWLPEQWLSQSRSRLAATSVGDLVLFGGGRGNTGILMKVVDVLDVINMHWLPTMDLSVSRYRLVATSAGGLGFFAGGDELTGASATVDIYNGSSGQWNTTAMSVGRDFLSACSSGALAFFAGGLDGPSVSTGARAIPSVDVFNVSSNQWLTPLSLTAGGLIGAASSHGVVLVGSGSNLSYHSTAVDIFDFKQYFVPSPVEQPAYMSPSDKYSPSMSPSPLGASPLEASPGQASPSTTPSQYHNSADRPLFHYLFFSLIILLTSWS
jgi:hypothetical protein